MDVLRNSGTDTQSATERNIEKQDWNVMYLWDSRSCYLFTRIAMCCIHMTNGRGVHSVQIYTSKVYTLSKAVHVFAHLAQGTFHFTASTKYGSVQSARDMKLSFTVKTPTDISVSPDTVSSFKSASISNCDLLEETRNFYSADKFNIPKMHLRIFNPFPLYFSLLPWALLILILGEHVWQLSL